jgi:hypothetical protein
MLVSLWRTTDENEAIVGIPMLAGIASARAQE